MNRINLVIADTDVSYLDSLANYILNNHSKWFQISTYSKRDNLINALEDPNQKIDVLLITPTIYSKELPLSEVRTTMILSSGRVIEECSHLIQINKYQLAEAIVSDILKHYTVEGSSEIINMIGDKRTKVIAVYSPAGGVGTTSLAVNLSVQYAARGISTFYLNLEDINSSHNHFPNKSDQNLSNVFYFIKENSKNLGMKIDSLKLTDRTNVNYFSVQESIFEIDEMTSTEIANLIYAMVDIGHYDNIIIDMSSKLNKKAMEIVKLCHKFICILTSDSVVLEKAKVLERDLARSINISDKTLVVANKYNYNSKVDSFTLLDNNVRFKLFYENNFRANSLDNSQRFNAEINKIIDNIN